MKKVTENHQNSKFKFPEFGIFKFFVPSRETFNVSGSDNGGFKILVLKVFGRDLSRDGKCKKLKF